MTVGRFQPAEARDVLHRLLAAHLELRAEVEEMVCLTRTRPADDG